MRRDAQQLALDGPQPRVLHPVLEHAPHERQQVEVARRGRARPARPAGSAPRSAASRTRARCSVTSQVSGVTQRAISASSAGSSAWSGSRSWIWRNASPSQRARPTRNASVPAAVASPVVSVSRQTSGASGGGWPGRPREPLAVERDLDRRDRPAGRAAARVVRDVGAEGGREPRGQHGAPPARERRPGRLLVRPDRAPRRRARASPAGSRAGARG